MASAQRSAHSWQCTAYQGHNGSYISRTEAPHHRQWVTTIARDAGILHNLLFGFVKDRKSQYRPRNPSDAQVLTLADQERSYILRILDQCRGRVNSPDGAARLLGVPASTLESKMKKLGIAKKHHTDEG